MDIRLTLESGQAFLWHRLNNKWYIINGTEIIVVSDDLNDNIAHLFRLDDDIDEINASINKDAIINNAIARFQGLRIMRQDPFQCLITFICATNTNMKRIRSMLMNISRFGKSIELDGYKFNLFPEPKVLADLSINELSRSGLGYRARYVKDASYAIANNLLDLEELRYYDYDKAKTELMKIKGIGNKVADCILLFSLEHLEAFPIDRWILKILREHYGFKDALTNNGYKIASKVMRDYFGRYAGYAQQYLYCYARVNFY